MLTYLCFLPGSLDGPLIAALVEQGLGFQPEVMSADAPGRREGVPFRRSSIEGTGVIGWISIKGDGGSFDVAGIAGWPGQVVAWSTRSWPPEELIGVASTQPGFVAAMIGDEDDVFWQSQSSIHTYELAGRPWEHLPTGWDSTFDRPIIDVSGNVGRSSPAPGMWLWAAAKTWFGPGAFSIVDRERVLSLPVGEVGPREDGAVIVDLFRPGDEQGLVRARQGSFRQWLGYDELEASAADLIEALDDPHMAFEAGPFAHGGIRRSVHWLQDGRLVPRSQATTVRLIELDEDGRAVWEATVPAGEWRAAQGREPQA